MPDTTVVTCRVEGFDATIALAADGFELCWSDGVVNEWTESYEHLSAAVARLAVLLHCGEHDFTVEFAHDPQAFAHDARDFHRDSTR
ncbi:hypothetical protein SUDANB95_07870 (plasmid) [Actinosynnema sp. ALI-1.44]